MRIFILLLIGVACITVKAQEKVITFGLQVKPIISSGLITDKQITQFEDNYEFNLHNNPGYSFGMVMRKGFTKNISLETGINYVQRNFTAEVQDDSRLKNINYDFSIVGYEIPTLALVYVRLSDLIYMNAAFGASIDFFPSDVGSNQDSLYHISGRRTWIMPSLLANIGWELRTKELGYFYLGGSFHRPFTNIYFTGLRYTYPGGQTESIFNTSGSYLTFDLRYFFHEDPQKAKAPKPVKKDLKYYRKLQKQAEKEKKKK